MWIEVQRLATSDERHVRTRVPNGAQAIPGVLAALDEAGIPVVSVTVSLPLMFLSSILITRQAMPKWMQDAARYNPVDWGVRAARNAVVVGGDWGPTGAYLALLLAATTAGVAFATWTFRAYQRSL
jgi:ABC-2 type transport system permease protein